MQKLFEALSLAQAEMKNPAFTRSVQAGSRSYEYAELNSILDQVRPVLAKHGLLIMQIPVVDASGFKLLTRLAHKSGEFIEGHWPLNEQAKAQEIGSAITYGRRYSICGLLGIQPDSDDDGQTAHRQQPQTKTDSYWKRPESKPVPNLAPQSSPQPDLAPGFVAEDMHMELQRYVIPFGTKYKGKTLLDIGIHEAKKYADWLNSKSREDKKALSVQAAAFCRMVDLYGNYVMEKQASINEPKFDPNEEIPF